jgi:hypothetical protein
MEVHCMSPRTISAQFAAFVWFTGQPQNADKDPGQAMQFAREKWRAFMNVAHPGLGRLLLRLARPTTDVAPRASYHQPFSCN